jgi:nicotinamide-nucleotide amidase
MIGEIIAIGDELTSGRITNTTSGFAARHLFEAGYEIYAMHTIGDTPSLIGEALKRAIGRVDFVIVTGGLGTTDDDLTNAAVSKALNRPSMPNLDILSQIRAHLDEISGCSISPLEKLAWLPKGAEALNPQGKMSGYQLVHNSKPIFFLPGIPSQMKHLLIDHVMPRLATWYTAPLPTTFQKLFKIFGITEIEVNSRIESLELPSSVSVGYYPVFPELHLSLTIRASEDTDIDELSTRACESIISTLGDAVFGCNQDEMESVVGVLLNKKGKTLAVAESCTGGLISHKITRVAGSSSYYLGGLTTYANSMKNHFLKVDQDLLDTHGAVSEEVAIAMVNGLSQETGADICLSVTGIAGPDGGTEEKPVGTVYIGFSRDNIVDCFRYNFHGSREQIQEYTALTGLNLIRQFLL